MPPMTDTQSMAETRQYATGVFMLIAAGLILGAGGLTYRVLDTSDPWAVAFGRSLFFCIVLGIICLIRYGRRLPAQFIAAGLPGIFAGIGLSMAFTGYTAAMLSTTVADVMFILSAGPFYAAGLGWLILRESVSRRSILFMLVAFSGIMVMVGGGVGGGRLEGNIWALMASLGFAIAVVSIRFRPAVEMLPAALLGGFIALIPGWVLMSDAPLTTWDWQLFVVIGGVQLALGFVLITFGSRHVRAAETPLLLMTEIITAPLWAWAAVGETPSVSTLVGGGIVCFAVMAQAVMRLRES